MAWNDPTLIPVPATRRPTRAVPVGRGAPLIVSGRQPEIISVLPITFMSLSSPSVVEGDSGMIVMRFVLSCDPVQDRDISFSYYTADGTATAGEDYQSVSGTGTLLAGQATYNLDVNIIGDTTIESNETVIMNVENIQWAN